MISQLFLASLVSCEIWERANPIHQYLDTRSTFIGGISLYALTPSDNAGTCPTYTQTCSGSCCPDGCCPFGTYCFVNGDYCCPNDTDCSIYVDSTPSCANSSWTMYARPAGAASPYFCCEPDQIALVPNQCVGSGFQLAGTSLATTAVQIGAASTSTVVSVNSLNTNTITVTQASASAGSSSVPSGVTGSPSTETGTTKSSNSSSSGNLGMKIGLGVGIPLGVLVIVLLGFICWRECARRRRPGETMPIPARSRGGEIEPPERIPRDVAELPHVNKVGLPPALVAELPER